MKILKVATLKHFWQNYPTAEQPLKLWVEEVKKANWRSPNDVKATYGNASILKNNRVVFNIKGNDFRLVTSIFYPVGWIYKIYWDTSAVR
ncbi:type II toxin-antitoxin system HigB family toxin [Testudinibacter sp. TR-2022]|uniref:type II toxin-antitoxin system HigB family toxin n=1 Tax=Testudinibacter sp. TR-2022 TaxID=2585029 RepID=UPI0022778E71|nr:type II toxin-antitoxin system HigB family toxin [Testudinibacter sp. TR-2022]